MEYAGENIPEEVQRRKKLDGDGPEGMKTGEIAR